MQFLYVAQVLLVIRGQVNGVVRYVVVTPFDTQVEHEGRAREALLLDPGIRPAAANAVRNHALHSLRKVSVDHYGIGGEGPVCSTHRGALAACKNHLIDPFVEQHFGAQIFRDTGHGFGDGATTTDGMKDSMLVLEKRQDAEQTGTGKWRH